VRRVNYVLLQVPNIFRLTRNHSPMQGKSWFLWGTGAAMKHSFAESRGDSHLVSASDSAATSFGDGGSQGTNPSSAFGNSRAAYEKAWTIFSDMPCP